MTAASVVSMFEQLSKWMLPIMLAVFSFQQTQFTKLEDRFFELQRDSVSKQELNAMEARVLNMIEVKLGPLNVKQDMANQQLQMIYQQIKESNAKK